jgi:hypothetical protein
MKYVSQRSTGEQKGCFSVNCMRELEVLPAEARELIMEHRKQLKQLFMKNVAAENPKSPPEVIADLILTFFSGFCLEQNLALTKTSAVHKVDDFIHTLRSM